MMKKMKIGRIIGFALLALLLILSLWISYIYFILPRIPVQELTVEPTPERVERGNYLAHHVTACLDCHSTRDWSKFSGPPINGTDGKGGEKFDQKMGFPGEFYSPNITPYKLTDWSDGEIYRAITSGVGKKNRPLFPVMPYLYYRHLTTGDVHSIIAYIRTLPAIAFQPPESHADFPLNIIMHTFPKPADPMVLPPKNDTINYGKYLVSIAACKECHSPFADNRLDETMAFAGGREFEMPTGILQSPNITPDQETGIGGWLSQNFLARFKAYDMTTYIPPVLKRGDLMTMMPWTMYAGMDTTDLVAIYTFLKTQVPQKHKVTRWLPFSK